MPRSTTRFVLSGFALLALAACAMQPAPPPPVAAAPPPVPSPTVAAPAFSDQDFVSRAVAGTALEVETSRLARTQAASPAVRAFGRQIASEHTRFHIADRYRPIRSDGSDRRGADVEESGSYDTRNCLKLRCEPTSAA